MAANDEEKFEGRMHGEQIEPDTKDNIWLRLIYMVLIAIMISVAQTVLMVTTLVQFVVMVLNKEPNERLSDFGTDLGIWIAKAARFQTAASNVKPLALDGTGLAPGPCQPELFARQKIHAACTPDFRSGRESRDRSHGDVGR